MKKKNPELSCRLGKVGGQAVLEGVMMKSGDETCLAVRKDDGTIVTQNKKFVSVRKKHKILNLPIVRGVVNFVEMMSLSMSTLTSSAEMLGIDDAEPETKFEKWLTEKLGDKLMAVLMAIASVLGVVLAVGLFFFVPTVSTNGIEYLFGTELGRASRSAVEGVLKIAVFVGYIALVSLMPDIRRTFQYHGAEHKSVDCYEKGLELTPENAAKCTRFHPRCGTSFIFVMLIISVFVGIFIPITQPVLRSLVKILLMPLSVGLGFEFIMYAGKHDNFMVKILAAPGLWMQYLTTREPDESQLEVAITALKGAIPAEFSPANDDSSEETPTEASEENAEEAGENNA